jgi:hypothetical protein
VERLFRAAQAAVGANGCPLPADQAARPRRPNADDWLVVPACHQLSTGRNTFRVKASCSG